jgi:microcystin-dependent protein
MKPALRSFSLLLLVAVTSAMDAVAQTPTPVFLGVPIGTVVAYAGDPSRLSSEWLLADGRSLRQPEYPELYAAIGTTHGTGVTMTGQKEIGYDFNLPDYRGLFLRGVDRDANGMASGRAPDVDRREAARGGVGNNGNAVGSFQADAIQSHKHNDSGHGHPADGLRAEHERSDNANDRDVAKRGSTVTIGTGHAQLGDPVDSGSGAGAVRHGKETRPANVGVWWIIRAK